MLPVPHISFIKSSYLTLVEFETFILQLPFCKSNLAADVENKDQLEEPKRAQPTPIVRLTVELRYTQNIIQSSFSC
jgi:hypothetical protein